MTWICFLLWVSLTSAARIYYNLDQQSKYRIDFRAVRLVCLCLHKQARANWRLGRLRSNRTNAPESAEVWFWREGTAQRKGLGRWSVIHEVPMSLYLPGKWGVRNFMLFLIWSLLEFLAWPCPFIPLITSPEAWQNSFHSHRLRCWIRRLLWAIFCLYGSCPRQDSPKESRTFRSRASVLC